MRLRRRVKVRPNPWAGTLASETAYELRAATDTYPSLRARRLSGDETAREQALRGAVRLAALNRAMVLQGDAIAMGTNAETTPLRAGSALATLECALIGLAQDPPDERAQLDDDQLEALLAEGDVRSWMEAVIAVAETTGGR
jgi:hypothetical protein